MIKLKEHMHTKLMCHDNHTNMMWEETNINEDAKKKGPHSSSMRNSKHIGQ